MSLRDKLPKGLKKTLRHGVTTTERFFDKIKFGSKRLWRIFFKDNRSGYSFAILCVKKTVYADLAIDNINSLHYLNPNHIVYIYCDNVCFDYLTKKNRLWYKDGVVLKNSYAVAERPWQYYKIETIIRASQNDQILIDADSVWHNDLVIDQNKVTILALAYKIKDLKNETLLMKEVFGKIDWQEFDHCVSAFVSIPKKFMTRKIEDDLRHFNDTIFTNSLDFIENPGDRESLRRLSEELAVNLALQTNLPPEMITTLKKSGDPGDKKTLQSLYYGCLNGMD